MNLKKLKEDSGSEEDNALKAKSQEFISKKLSGLKLIPDEVTEDLTESEDKEPEVIYVVCADAGHVYEDGSVDADGDDTKYYKYHTNFEDALIDFNKQCNTYGAKYPIGSWYKKEFNAIPEQCVRIDLNAEAVVSNEREWRKYLKKNSRVTVVCMLKFTKGVCRDFAYFNPSTSKEIQ